MEQEEKEKADKELADREEEFKKLDKPPDSNDNVKV